MEVLNVHYGIHKSPFGMTILGLVNDRIAYLGFDPDPYILASDLSTAQRSVAFCEDLATTTPIFNQIFSDSVGNLPLFFEGSTFQSSVWKTLLKIPRGQTWSYTQVANAIGSPQSVRAVGAAIAQNPISILIPCHRVLAKSGALGGYRWGLALKRAILASELTLGSSYTRVTQV